MPKLRNLHKLLDPEIRAKNLQALKLGAARPLVGPGPPGDARPGVPGRLLALRHHRDLRDAGRGAAVPELRLGDPAVLGQAVRPAEQRLAIGGRGRRATRGPSTAHAALRYFYQRLGAGWVLDKTCINVMRIPYLHALFPQAKFVFIQRDGRDNISSMMDGWRQGRTDGASSLSQFFGPFPEPVAINGGEFTDWAFFLAPGWRAYNRASLEEVCAFQWMSPTAWRWTRSSHPAGAVDSPALRGHLRAPGGDVPRRLRALGRAVHRRAARALRAPAAHQHRQGRAEEAEVERAQPGGHRAHPAGDRAADARDGL